MSQKPIGPEEIIRREAYIKGLRRAERRILIAGSIVNSRVVDLSNFHYQRPLILHLERSIRARGFEPFTTALMKLRIARSKHAAILEGLEW